MDTINKGGKILTMKVNIIIALVLAAWLLQLQNQQASLEQAIQELKYEIEGRERINPRESILHRLERIESTLGF